jgi:hypothetical protein
MHCVLLQILISVAMHAMFLAALRTVLLFFEHHTLNDGLFPNTTPHDRQQYG